MNKEFIEALEGLSQEKHIPKEVLLDTVKAALLSAYRKNYGISQNVRVEIDEETGEITVLSRLDIVEEVTDESIQMSLEEAHEIDPRYQIGDYIEFEVTTEEFGRIAAQTAKQVVVQRIREAERVMIYEDFKDRQGEVVTGIVQRKSGRSLFIDLGHSEGILPSREQVPGERFEVNDRLKVYIMDVKDVKKYTRGPQVFLSRSHPGLVKRLFEMEVPEIQDGIVEIKGIAREAGSRTKIAVWSEDENVDPVGACVGSRGNRVQEVVRELNGEKIDIICWSEDPEELIRNVLSPAKVEEVIVDEEEKMATAIVPDYQLSLAIGKTGQNVRLAVRVSGWDIDIKSVTQYYGDDIPEGMEVEDPNGADYDYDEETDAEKSDIEEPLSEELPEEPMVEETSDEAPAAEEASIAEEVKASEEDVIEEE